MKQWDAVIIGGGPAGSAAAILLARSGVHVLLVEKEAAAHHKVCGEFISCEAQDYLAALNIDLVSLGAESIRQVRLVRGASTVNAPLPFKALSLSRYILDEALLSRAKSEGAEILRGAAVTNLVKVSSGWQMELAGHDAISAKTVFLATGKHDLRGWRRTSDTQDGMIGFKLHMTLCPHQTAAMAGSTEIILFKGGYAGLELIENGKANVCLVVRKSSFAAHQKDWSRLLQSILQVTPALATRLAEAIPAWQRPLAIYGIPYGFVYKEGPDAPKDLYRLGDQMAVIPSFCGDGMAIALYTAFLAVGHYAHGNASLYHHCARTNLLPQITLAVRLSHMMTSFWTQKVMLTVCRFVPAMLTSMAKNTRLRILQDKNEKSYSILES